MQEKPLLTLLQSAYPNKSHNSFIYFFFWHELRTISPEENNPVYNTKLYELPPVTFSVPSNFHDYTQRHK